ncbi:MAG TPA: DUF1924 domain-containing protein [Gallionella sp.]|nr:DUF1924 domain-containing protein [Gallionella sp.]
MLRKFIVSNLAMAAITVLMAQPVLAETPDEMLTLIKKEARTGDASFQGFSASRGEKFFKQKQGGEWSCSSCHGDNPAATGKHAKTDKTIQPMAPAANAERFTDPKKVAKWFKRNCNDVLNRVCTPQEKGDVLSYLLTVKK